MTSGPHGEPDWDAALRADPDLKIHLYGKRTARPGRKMGHMTVLDADPAQALARVVAARNLRTPTDPDRIARMRLAEPVWLALMVLAALPWLFNRARPRASWPSLGGFGKSSRLAARLRSHVPLLIRGIAIGCVAVALARPQTVAGRTRIAARGVAILLVLDHSSSMNTKDFPSGESTVSRLEAARETLARFIAGRPDDLIGLVVFANYPDVASPSTLDHAYLTDVVRAVRTAPPAMMARTWATRSFWDSTRSRRKSPGRRSWSC